MGVLDWIGIAAILLAVGAAVSRPSRAFYRRVFAHAWEQTRSPTLLEGIAALTATVATYWYADASDASLTGEGAVVQLFAGVVVFGVFYFLVNLVKAPSAVAAQVALERLHDFQTQAEFVATPHLDRMSNGAASLYLRIHNDGPTSEFEAQLWPIAGMAVPPSLEPIPVKWEGTEDRRYSITRGLSHRLRVCHFHPADLIPKAGIAGGAAVFFRPRDLRPLDGTLANVGEPPTQRRAIFDVKVASVDPAGQKSFRVIVTYKDDGKGSTAIPWFDLHPESQ